MKYYVVLLDLEWRRDAYTRGDIVITDSAHVPPSMAFASFEPPAGLAGRPVLERLEDPGTGDLVFKYRVDDTKTRFVLKARIGIPIATLTVVTDPVGVHPQPTDDVVLEFGPVVRWRKCLPEPQPEDVWDPLRWEG